MRTVEFQARRSENSLSVPADVASQIPVGEDVAVIVFIGDQQADEWVKSAQEKLLDSYEPEDSIYDTLYVGSDVR